MKKFSVVAFSLLFSALAVPVSAQTKTVWEIGKFDQSHTEFHPGARDHVLYEVGKSDWSRDWPDTQSVGSNYEILFNLGAAPKGTFTLKVGIQVWRPGVPALQMEINGHKGTYYLQPKLSYAFDDGEATSDPHYSVQTLTILIPAKYMSAGPNHLILSYVDQPPPLAQSDHSGFSLTPPAPVSSPTSLRPEIGFSAIHYDALSMTNEAAQHYTAGAIQADVTPTIFYRMEAGHLVEIVEAILHFAQGGPACTAVLAINGQRYTVDIPARKDFGDERVQFEVPEWTGTVQGRLEITARRHAPFELSLTAARKWTVFVVPHTHIDVGFTDFQGKVSEAQARTLDEAIGLIEKHPDFRFSIDGSWTMQQFLATRSAEQREKLLGLIRKDEIGVPAVYATLLTGYASLETLYRSLYYSKELSRKYNLPYNYSDCTDVPTYTGAYPSILASAGIKYLALGTNNNHGSILTTDHLNEKSPFWWQGPDGKKVLIWYSRHYQQVQTIFGLPPQQAAIYESLPIFLQAYSSPDYKPDVSLLYGAQGENTDLYSENATFATEWNQSYAFPHLKYATFPDFFQYVEKQYGDTFPTLKGDMGPYWENGEAADAYNTAKSRENESNAVSAEVVSTVAADVDPDVHPPKAELDDAWKNIVLYAEHTFGANVSVRRPDSEEAVRQLAVKDNYVTQAAFDLEDVSNRAMSQLANEIHVPAGTLVVFNTLSWKRDALVETDLSENETLVDMTTHENVPVQVLFNKQGFDHVRFVASGLPAVGYKCFQIESAPESTPAETSVTNAQVVENQYYRITVDPGTGAVESIYDKQLQRELVDSHSPYKFGQYLYVTGAEPGTRIIQPFIGFPLVQLVVHPAEKGEYLGTQKTAWGYSIRLRSTDVNTPSVNLEILLYNGEKKIELRYDVQKNYTTEKEAAYFAFPLALTTPRFAYATQQGWVDPAKDIFKGGNLEWFSIQKWMAANDAGLAVGIVPEDAPLATFGDINRGTWPTEFHPESSTIFSYIMNNYWETNYAGGQGGMFHFRYVVTSADHLEPVALTRLGWESMEAPVLDDVVRQDKVGNPERPLPAEGTGFLTINAPNVALVDWKMAEDGKGTILRFQEMAGKATEATIELPHSTIHSANLCNAVEDNLHDLKASGHEVQLSFRPNEVLTIRLMP